MKRSIEERIAIGCRIYHRELSLMEAVEIYGDHHTTLSFLEDSYRERYNLPERCPDEYTYQAGEIAAQAKHSKELMHMNKDQLIAEIIKVRTQMSQFQDKNKKA